MDRPSEIPAIRGAIQVANGCYHGLALKPDGTVWSWGNNGHGQLGDGTNLHRSNPVRVMDVEDATAVAAGCWVSFALLSTGTVVVWGDVGPGYSSDGGLDQKRPAAIDGLPNITSIAAGSDYLAAVADDGSVWGWGSQNIGGIMMIDQQGCRRIGLQPGNTTACPAPAPRKVAKVEGLQDARQVAVGSRFSLALMVDGDVFSWGSEGSGVHGYGTDSGGPAKVELSNATMVAAGSSHAVVLHADGSVSTWGRNTRGQLGDGTNADRRWPSKVPGLEGVVAVSANLDQSMAILDDGRVVWWGLDGSGRTQEARASNVPTLQCGIAGALQVAPGTPNVALLGEPVAPPIACPDRAIQTTLIVAAAGASVGGAAVLAGRSGRTRQWSFGAASSVVLAVGFVMVLLNRVWGTGFSGDLADAFASRTPVPVAIGLPWLVVDVALLALLSQFQPPRRTMDWFAWLSAIMLAVGIVVVDTLLMFALLGLRDFHLTSVQSWDAFSWQYGHLLGAGSRMRWLLAGILLLMAQWLPRSKGRRRMVLAFLALAIAGFQVLSWASSVELEGPGVPAVPWVLGWGGLVAGLLAALVAMRWGGPDSTRMAAAGPADDGP